MKQVIFNNNIANTDNVRSFKYKAKLSGNTVAQPNPNEAINSATAVLLKYLSNFWRSLEIPLINCKVELKLQWTKYFVLSAAANDNDINNANDLTFTIKDTKLYVPVVTLSKRDNKKSSKTSQQRI